ncbi:MAG: hypothetical protein H0S85_07025 [Desulfovibrionaceae bacterium]|jgi:hypothetical protein|nr:hypothetical protein [Desulfovibrionaceae bacterium]
MRPTMGVGRATFKESDVFWSIIKKLLFAIDELETATAFAQANDFEDAISFLGR